MAGVKLSDLKLVIPHDVNAKSREVMGALLGVPASRVYSKSIKRTGHAVAADNVLNHVDAVEEGALLPGDKAMVGGARRR